MSNFLPKDGKRYVPNKEKLAKLNKKRQTYTNKETSQLKLFK